MNAFKKTPAEVIGSMHPLFKGLQWVAVARSDDETRHTLCHVLVEQEGLITRIVATDGRRIHVHEYYAGLFDTDIFDDLIQPGLYEIVAKSKKFIVITPCETDLDYPNWRQVIPDHVPTRTAAVNEANLSLICVRTGVVLAVDFLKEACGFGCGAGHTQHVTFGSAGPMDALVITHELGKAVVMPIRDIEGAEDEKQATAQLKGLNTDDA